MSAASIAAALITALEAAAAREAGGPCALASVNVEMLAAPATGEARVKIERKTRTMMFLSAEYLTAAGERIASAASVHKVIAP